MLGFCKSNAFKTIDLRSNAFVDQINLCASFKLRTIEHYVQMVKMQGKCT